MSPLTSWIATSRKAAAPKSPSSAATSASPISNFWKIPIASATSFWRLASAPKSASFCCFSIVGGNDYPFPIPLERVKGGLWSFDTVEGRNEILYRRIGRNELDAIQTCLAYVDAQNEYAEKDRTGAGVGVYAQRFISEPGKKDGLYWPAAQGEEESPLGELFADASREGYRTGQGRSPYHGYYYKILTKQGPAAPGGAADYVVDGKMIGGFALVAYPAEYRNSGVMSFIVNYKGTVFQKDLGPKTADIAEGMTTFNPSSTWRKVDVTETKN